MHIVSPPDNQPFGNAQILLRNDSGSRILEDMICLQNRGGSQITFDDISAGFPGIWSVGTDLSSQFRIQSDSGSANVVLDAEEAEVTIGTRLKVTDNLSKGIAGRASIVVDNTDLSTGIREMFSLRNNGGTRFTMENIANGAEWAFASDAVGRFTFSVDGTGGPEFLIAPNGRVSMGPGTAKTFDLTPSGNLTITGTLSQSSDVNLKKNFQKIDSSNVLERIAKLPVTTWQFKSDADSVRHMGPTAQDFRAAFGLGENETTIAPVDGIGVSLAALKALKAEVDTLQQASTRKDTMIEDLLTKLDEQSEAVNELKARLSNLEAR